VIGVIALRLARWLDREFERAFDMALLAERRLTLLDVRSRVDRLPGYVTRGQVEELLDQVEQAGLT
jgi:hypothetical protein